MLRRKLVFLTVAALVLGTAVSSMAVTRAAKRYGVLDFSGGYSSPIGTYDHISIIDFTDDNGVVRELDADKVYKGTYNLGFSLGQLRDHWLFSFGFYYTRVQTQDIFWVNGTRGLAFQVGGEEVKPSFHQFDFKLNTNYQFSDLGASSFTPYVGLGLAGGLIAQRFPGAETEYEGNVLVSGNFGAEFKIWKSADDRNFATLASVNSIDLLKSGYRPRYLNIGAAIRFYMRP